MVQRSVYLKESAVKEVADRLEKKDYEKDKALLEIEKEYQQMYDELNNIHKEYETKIEQLIQEKPNK